ncbi:EF-hand domain-containing protein [uncultured Sphingomonas sp.]|uniref:EF-hand domain-containing protein n=1 Tax=uncultured Sphingomonas sp. TaxID=158754 RepID=UPI0035CBC2A6
MVPIAVLAAALQVITAAGSPPAPQGPAQPPATILVEPAAMFVAACDANGDARVTRAELDSCVARSFATMDGAAAGRIGYIAYADWEQRWLGDRNALPSPFEVDTDGDDHISLTELQARFRAYFDRFDLDRDGVLTRAELVTIHATAPNDPDRRGKKRK